MVGIADWVATRSRMIASLQDAALTPDPLPVFKQMATAGGFTNVYAGYADKAFHFSDPTGIPPDYDPTGRPWQAGRAGRQAGRHAAVRRRRYGQPRRHVRGADPA